MAHRNAKLTPLGRLVLVQRVVNLGWPVSQTAAALGISRPTAHKWLNRWKSQGPVGLDDHSSRPHRSPHATPQAQVEQIRILRLRLRWGPHRLAPVVGSPRSTVYAVLRREGLTRLRDLDRSTGVPLRYVREHPGELLHVDTKALGRIPAGGGHRILGRESVPNRHTGLGYEMVHAAIDDMSRVGFVQILPDRRGPTCAAFLLEAAAFFAEQGIRIERVMTDQDSSYRRSRAFKTALQDLGVRHKMTRPYRPQTNGKVERFIQTLLREWAYGRAYRTNEERQKALPKWLHYYNHHRPHTALEGRPPAAAMSVNNVCGNHT